VAGSGIPTRITRRLATGTFPSEEMPPLSEVAAQPTDQGYVAAYRPDNRTQEPERAGGGRRHGATGDVLGPAAVSVRRSLEVSLRTSPTDRARMPRARTIPKTVAQSMISYEPGWSFFDSTDS
jgi:hypothetical protein